ncbi:hypothetical protein PENSUB_5705 [Penicillium subrubescens]|uniref:Clr5 domain-containing protein n=1 Tax=Penicillium subrubescens TaxID=1316194 RepID=A0A1Q5U7C8_9EURO|nr:hypothetical protein PENSUB_5705 [Penicillium subrubescens]
MTPRIDIDLYKDDITNIARRGESDRAIAAILSNDYGVTVTGRTISNRLVE